MTRYPFLLSCAIHGGVLAMVGWSSLIPAPSAERSGAELNVSILAPDNALVLEDTSASIDASAPAEISLTPPERMLEPPLQAPESPLSIRSTSAANESAAFVPATQGRVSSNAGVSRRAAISKSGGAAGYVPPHFLVRHTPPYPAAARARKLEGVVLLFVAVDGEGRVTSASVRQTSGHAVLDHAALDSIRSWRFTPARQGDHAIPATVQVPIRFTI